MTLYCLTMNQNVNYTVDLGPELNPGILFWKTVDTLKLLLTHRGSYQFINKGRKKTCTKTKLSCSRENLNEITKKVKQTFCLFLAHGVNGKNESY